MSENKLSVFIAVLKNKKDSCHRAVDRRKYEHALQLAEAVDNKFASCLHAIDEMQILSRYVSDSLPWDDEILRSWCAVQKQLGAS